MSGFLYSRVWGRTRFVSLDASLSMGIINKKKKTDSMANPFAARSCSDKISNCPRNALPELDQLTTTP
jgi:hypothetical protein